MSRSPGKSQFDIKASTKFDSMMRTTLTIDDDVAVLIERVRNERGTNFKSLVNEALRHGLRAMTEKPARERHFQTQPLDLGECLLPSLDNIGDVLAMLEGEDHR